MARLNQRGASPFEFTLVAFFFLGMIFGIFDLGRYLITVQSLRNLAGAGARQLQMHDCYVDYVLKKQAPSGCPSDPLTLTQKQDAAPFLYQGGLTPTLSASADTAPATTYTVTASQPGFTPVLAFLWGSQLNAPSVTTKLPY